MKKSTVAFAASLILFGTLDSFAQTDFVAKGTKPYQVVDYSSLLKADNAASGNSISFLNSRLLKKFNHNFPGASNAFWYQDGDLTRFYFEENEKTVRSAMSRKGDVVSTIRYYNASLLPAYMQQEIRYTYKGYRPEQVTEVNFEGRSAYIINLKGIEDWLQVRYLDGEITELGRFTY